MADDNVILQHNYYEERRSFGRTRRVPDGTGFLHVELDGIIRSAVIPGEIFPAVSNAVIALQRQIAELHQIVDEVKNYLERNSSYAVDDGEDEDSNWPIVEMETWFLKLLEEARRG